MNGVKPPASFDARQELIPSPPEQGCNPGKSAVLYCLLSLNQKLDGKVDVYKRQFLSFAIMGFSFLGQRVL